MKKKLSLILLSLVLAITTFSFTACNDEDNPSGLTAEQQQVKIAQDTINGIYQAETNKNANPLMAMMSFTETEKDFYDSLFDKYDYDYDSDNFGRGFYLLSSQCLSTLLDEVNTDTLSKIYKVSYDLTNYNEGDLEFIGQFTGIAYLDSVNFSGVVEEGDYNKVYFSINFIDYPMGSITSNMTIDAKMYYNSEDDYGFEMYMFRGDSVYSYNSYDKKTDRFITIYANGEVQLNNNRINEVSNEDLETLLEMIEDYHDVRTETTLDLEKSNNNGMIKTISTDERLQLEFDCTVVYEIMEM